MDGEISTAQVEVRSTVALAAAGYGTAVAMAAVEYNDAVIQKLRFIKKKILEMESASAAQSEPGKKPGRLRDKEKEIYKITAVLDRERCVNCGICVDLCPENAISTDGDVRIDPDKCSACGTCISVCPNEAISLPGKVRAAIS